MEEILEVLAANKAQQARARQFNIRAGEQLFPVLDQAQMIAWMTEKAAGARRMAEIADPEALRLPALDEALIETVIRENPDEVELLGVMRSVVYQNGYNPKISLENEAVAENCWLALPDEGVFLPGGRAVEVEISFGYYSTFRNANVPELKEKVRNYLNQQLWDNWPSAGRPEIFVPDPADEGATIPEITTVQYGQCVVTRESLLAYGTLAPKSRYYTADPYFVVQWYRSLEEAEGSRAKSVEKLEKARAEALEEREVKIAKAEAEVVKAEFISLFNENYNSLWSELPKELRNQLYEWRYESLPSSSLEIRQWQAETEALIAEVEPALAEVQRQKEAAEQKAREEQEARERAEEARRISEEEAHRTQLEEILAAAKSVLGYVPEIYGGYMEIAGQNGTYLQNWGRLAGIDCNGEPTAYCDKRDAVVVQSVECAGGVLEFLSYYKYGGNNLAARWRELTEAEVAQVTKAKAVQVEALEEPKPIEDSATALQLLQARFQGLNNR